MESRRLKPNFKKVYFPSVDLVQYLCLLILLNHIAYSKENTISAYWKQLESKIGEELRT